MATYDEVITALRAADQAGNVEDATRLAQIAVRLKPPEAEQKPFLRRAGEAFGESGLQLLSGAAAAPIAGLTGLAQGAKNIFSQGMPAGERVTQVQEALTYQPRSQGGQALTSAITYPLQKLEQGAHYVGGNVAEATGSPALGAAVNTAIQSAPSIVARGLKAPAQKMLASSAQKAADLKSINAVKDATINQAREYGYVFPPSEIQGSFLGNKIESMGGKAALGQEANRRNQQVTNRIGREEAGLNSNEALSLDNLNAARDRMAAPYREVASVSTKAGIALEALQDARRLSKEQWDFFHRSLDPSVKMKAKSLDAEALRLEGVIDAEAVKLGRPDLLSELKEARKNIAKNYDVERALNVGSGDLDARIWGRMIDHEKPLTGGLKVAALTAEAMSRFTKEASSVPTPGVSKLHSPSIAAVLGVGGHAALGPAGWALGALPFLDAPARSLALSKAMQTPRTYGPGKGVGLLELATRRPEALAISPAFGMLPKDSY